MPKMISAMRIIKEGSRLHIRRHGNLKCYQINIEN
jgi:hypothetical protein